MAAGRLGSVLQVLFGSFQTAADAALTDRQLLDRFLHERDEAAFASLVQRHAAMVLAVARKVLHDAPDCEDVFQAAFLVLAKKAGVIRRRRALGGWLYQVAFRLALKAKAERTRRQIHERQVAEMAQAVLESSPVECDELREALAQELSGLPEKYRAPLVLHYLEGRTKSETAYQLGWSSGTVSGRLARARKLLKSRMVKRGFTLSSSTFAAHFVQNDAAAISKPLLDSAVRAGIAFAQGLPMAGPVSAAAVRLAGGMLQQMAATKFKLIALALLALTVFGAGATAVIFGASAQPAAQSPHAPEAPADADAAPIQGKDQPALLRLSASGKVVDLQGKPVANAAVYFLEMAVLRMNTQTTRPDYTDILAQTKSDNNGAFEFRDVRVEPMRLGPSNSYRHPWTVVALAKGCAVAWHTFKADSEHNLVLRMTPEARIRGRLLDPSGKPAAGVRVQFDGVRGSLNPEHYSGDDLQLMLSRLPLSAVTNSDGWFVMDGIPKGLPMHLFIDDSRFARKMLTCATVDEATIDHMNRMENVRNAGERVKLLKDGFTTTLEPAGTIRGQVVFGDTGKPALGAKIMTGIFETLSDREGRFALKGFDTKKREVYVKPPEDSDYLPVRVDATIPTETRTCNLRISLERGSVITGQLREKETGHPIRVPNVGIYFTTVQNGGTTSYAGHGSTRADGSFRIAVRPGVGWISTSESLPGYVPRDILGEDPNEDPPEQFEVKAGETVTGKDLFFQSGLTVSGKVLDPKGQPVAGAVFLGATPQAPSGADGSYTLRGLSLDQQSHFLVVHAQRALGAKLVIEPRKDQARLTMDVTLQPAHSVQARVLDEQSQPVANASVSLAANISLWKRGRTGAVKWVPVSGPVSTDADGRFALPLLVINGSYSIQVSAPGYAAAKTSLRVGPDQPPAVSDITLLTNKLTIAGIIVDQTGKPLEGIQAWIQARNSTIDPSTRTQSMRTDKEGRFCFPYLPRGEYRFMATLWKPTGELDKNGAPKNVAAVRKQLRVQAGDDKLRIELTIP